MSLAVAYFEPTPNPNAFKFHTGATLIPAGKQLSFQNPIAAERLPLASQLFDLGYVDAVLIAEDFVSVSGKPTANWPEIKKTVELALIDYDTEAATLLAGEMATERSAALSTAAENPLYQQVNDLFETYVRPALAGDGGGIELLEVEDNIVRIRYQGACGSCPTSTASTMSAIQNLLRDKISPSLVIENG